MSRDGCICGCIWLGLVGSTPKGEGSNSLGKNASGIIIVPGAPACLGIAALEIVGGKYLRMSFKTK